MQWFQAIVVKIRVLSSSLNIGNTKFTHNLHWPEMQFSDFCCDETSPDGRDVQAGLSDQMAYQSHVDRWLVFPIGGVWFSNTITVLDQHWHKLSEKDRTKQRKARAKRGNKPIRGNSKNPMDSLPSSHLTILFTGTQQQTGSAELEERDLFL
jgi:hypothetical protein